MQKKALINLIIRNMRKKNFLTCGDKKKRSLIRKTSSGSLKYLNISSRMVSSF